MVAHGVWQPATVNSSTRSKFLLAAMLDQMLWEMVF
jgi:hypothetical protein